MTPSASDAPVTLLREVRSRVPVDAAALLAQATPEDIEAVLRALPPDFAARIAAHLPGAADDMPEIDSDARIEALMAPAVGMLPPNTTVAGAVDWLSRCPEVADVTYLYVVAEDRRLLGMVVMRDLLLARPGQQLSDVMLHDPFHFTPQMDIGDAIRAAVSRHYPVYPVCDDSGRLVGLVRGWQLFERQVIEISAQSGTMVGLDKEERLTTPFWQAFRRRHPWLQVNLMTAFLAAFVVGVFEDTIARTVALAAFLPVLAGQSGNSGCQTLAITLRGVTLGDLRTVPVRVLLRKEILMGALNGVLTGVVAAVAMWWFASDAPDQRGALALVILLAMSGACALSGLCGVLVPVTLRRFGADPATASSIFLTTGTDIAGMGLMLFLATLLVAG